VPLVFAAPGVIPAGRSLSQQVQSLDVAPTLLEFLGLPPEPRHQGMSLAPALLRGEPLPERGLRFSSRFCRGVRRTTLKYARYETHEDSGCLPEGTEELYDLAQDPDELHDLAGSGDPRLAEARAELDRLEQDAALPLPGLEGRDGAREALPDLHLDEGVDPEIQRLLHEWGYR